MKISIITVCLNSEQTIEKTIQSVMEQNDTDYEYIVIDGGSTDHTLDILNKYKKEISLIVSELDHGIYDAMNKGIALSTGELIGIINSDDWYEPDAFRSIREYFNTSDADVVYGKVNIYEKNEIIKIQIPTNIEKIRYEMEIPHPSVFIKRDTYIKYGTFQQKYKIAADYELMLRLYTNGVEFAYIDTVLANFRKGGISELQGTQVAKETLEIALKYLSYAPSAVRKTVNNIIAHRRRALCFDMILEKHPDVIQDVLIKKMGVNPRDHIAIFGAGKWGIKTYEALLKREILPDFFIDNNENKWKQKQNGKSILSPESLKTYEGVLLIMVKESGSEILSQVKRIASPGIYWITWEEIVVECMMVKNAFIK